MKANMETTTSTIISPEVSDTHLGAPPAHAGPPALSEAHVAHTEAHLMSSDALEIEHRSEMGAGAGVGTHGKVNVIGRIIIRTATEEDYMAYHTIGNEESMRRKAFLGEFLRQTGYNPGSPLGNKQHCSICGKSGSECIGHPLVMNLSHSQDNNSSSRALYLSEFGVKTIRIITSITCRKCKKIVHDKTDESTSTNNTLNEILKISKSNMICPCFNEGAGVKPLIKVVSELAYSEDELKKKEWRAGRQVVKKRTLLKLDCSNLSEVYNLILDLKNNGELARIGINADNVLNLFYNKVILQPASIHQMNFKRGISEGVDEITGMMNKYAEMYAALKRDDSEKIQEIMRELSVALEAGKFSGIQSHVVSCDGKTGLLRGPALSKRSKDTGRSVLAPTPQGRTGEVSLSRFIASNLQYGDIVSVHNKHRLQERVGKTVTHFVIPMETSTTNGRVIFKKITPDTILRYGDNVLKCIEEGDRVSFTRHPILHRGSMLSERVSIWDDYCIGTHQTNTQSLNADFDGDEGNITIGADVASRIDLAMIDCAYNLFGGRSGEATVGIAYNGIVGAFVLSTHDNIPEKSFRELMRIISDTDLRNPKSHIKKYIINEEYYKRKAEEHNIPYMSGRTLISMLLPRGLFYKRSKEVTLKILSDSMLMIDGESIPYSISVKNKIVFSLGNREYNTDKIGVGETSTTKVDDVIIRDGFMLSGNLRATDVQNKLIIAISMIDKYLAPRLFVDRGYAMMGKYIDIFGLTISARDYVKIGKDRYEVVPENFEEELIKAFEDVMRWEMSKISKTPATQARIEEMISHRLDKIMKSVYDRLQNGPYRLTDNATISYRSGARGTVGNIASATSLVGQVYSNNRRYNPSDSRSSLYSDPDSMSIFDRSFILTSYAQGLSPDGVLQVAGPARIQALNTYLNTPVSGELSKKMELQQDGIHVSNTLSLVGRDGQIVDSLVGYGCNGNHVTYRETPLGMIESPVDALAVLHKIRARKATSLNTSQ
jgi:DNA-directed RNA polymerase beta' subunit